MEPRAPSGNAPGLIPISQNGCRVTVKYTGRERIVRYNLGKRMESILKGLFVDRSKLSAVEPTVYGNRLFTLIEKHLT